MGDANLYPIDYIKSGYIIVYVSLNEKAWKKIYIDAELKEEEPILLNHFVNQNTCKQLTVKMQEDNDQEVLNNEITVKKKSKYQIFMKDYMNNSDKSIAYKIRFKTAIELWHKTKI
jgi:hypothetical protein